MISWEGVTEQRVIRGATEKNDIITDWEKHFSLHIIHVDRRTLSRVKLLSSFVQKM